MILGFKPQFVPKILAGTKIHTIREDKFDRWPRFLKNKRMPKIHMATGVRTKKYNCFAKKFVQSIQKIEIHWIVADERMKVPNIYVNGKNLNSLEIFAIAVNDGFESTEQFFKWFNKDFTGKIIHWTDFRY
jgi:predicted patatin/cPLA2 family phospholipase